MRFQPTIADKKGLRLDDEVRFIRSWLDKPLATGAVTPSGRFLARAMARQVDIDIPGPVVELGPGTGPITEALVDHGVDPSRLVLVEFNPVFCRLLRSRYPQATVVQGDAYNLKRLLADILPSPAAAVVSGLPLAHEARADTRAADQRRLPAQPGCVLHPVHLLDDHAADPEGPCPRRDRSVGPHLAEFPAGTRVGLSPRLIVAR
jgi:phospholipid N-methyltransferase